MISAKNIRKKYGNLEVLKGVSLEIHKGEIVCIVGKSGAGKSTLLHILGTLDKPDEGEVRYNDLRIDQLKDSKLSAFRNKHIGFVFQFHHLLPEFTALENVIIPALIKGESIKIAEKRGQYLLEKVGLSHRLHHKPTELSGGEQQRVAVARALMNQPKVIFADEPTGNLDSHNAETLHQLFFDLRNEFGQTFVIVTHNEHLASMADRTIHIVDGKILE